MHAPAKRQTVKITIWARPAVKQELQRIAEAEGFSVSRAGAAGLEDWLAKRFDTQYARFLEPIIQHALAKGMRGYSSRLATLLIRDLFVNEQTRAITYNILRKPPGLTLTDEAVDKIMIGSKNTAKRNIAQVDPELLPVIQAIDTWLEQGVGAAHD
ncbi:MAG TPA: hypothetical protein VJ761_17705 [Ktedonobacteraceae bacterium]|nr:hypothetical protein [Ktedonobacteraceae bacterium]